MDALPERKIRVMEYRCCISAVVTRNRAERPNSESGLLIAGGHPRSDRWRRSSVRSPPPPRNIERARRRKRSKYRRVSYAGGLDVRTHAAYKSR
ncbi:hypothetical protein Trydic_g398 [Trypoxylus dichotomus]